MLFPKHSLRTAPRGVPACASPAAVHYLGGAEPSV